LSAFLIRQEGTASSDPDVQVAVRMQTSKARGPRATFALSSAIKAGVSSMPSAA
jgi:hypothetical protein